MERVKRRANEMIQKETVIKVRHECTTGTAKLFKNGSSQAVRLPSKCRFQGSEVYVTRNNKTGDVTLSSYPGVKAWNSFFELVHRISVADDFMSERPMNKPPKDISLFEDIK